MTSSRSVTVDLSNPVQCLEVGKLALEHGKYDDAKKLLATVIERCPNTIEAYVLLAKAYLHTANGRQSEVVKAENALRACLQIAPDNEHVQFHLGLVMNAHGRQVDGVPYFKRAAELAPGWAHPYYCWAYGLVERGEFEAAKTPLEKCLEIDPSLDAAATLLKEVGDRLKAGTDTSRAAFWPLMKSEFSDLETAISKHLLGDLHAAPKSLNKDDKIITLGSCFARNVAHSLAALGVDARNVGITEDINNTYTNRYFLEWLVSNDHSDIPVGVLEALPTIYPGDKSSLISDLEDASMLIYTLGVAPCFFDRTGKPYLPTNDRISYQRLADSCDFRTTSVGENVDNVRAAIETLRRLNPGLTIILSVSPVPLKLSFESKSAVITDCLSKSTLRVAVEEVMRQGLENIYYWPSFEVFRWFGPYVPDVFGEEDGDTRHPSERVLASVMRMFLQTFGDASIRPANAGSPESSLPPALP